MASLARLVLSVLSALVAVLTVTLAWRLGFDPDPQASPVFLFRGLALATLPAWLLVAVPTVLFVAPGSQVFHLSRLPLLGLLLGCATTFCLLGPFGFVTPIALAGPAIGVIAGSVYAAANAWILADEHLAEPHPPRPAPIAPMELPYLTVLYDSSCGLCYRARLWLEDQDQYVPLRFVATNSASARASFPTLDHELSQSDVTVIGPAGQVWRGAEAWLMCMWATWSFRGLSQDLATPAGMRRARQFIESLSGQRHRISAALRLQGEECDSCHV